MKSIISDEFICSNDGENLCKKSQLYLSLKCANNANQYIDLGGDSPRLGIGFDTMLAYEGNLGNHFYIFQSMIVMILLR
jgi:hypothetical protein